ncbi:hypothetical protein [Microbacterium sp. NPDC089188]|uniref:hypothetical protein n=1 Tax=Microbacterium sp. NPDC089188 TaxID=3154971 RepID=UPI003422EC10
MVVRGERNRAIVAEARARMPRGEPAFGEPVEDQDTPPFKWTGNRIAFALIAGTILFGGTLFGIFIVLYALAMSLPPGVSIAIGIGLVVAVGATGLILRGCGEVAKDADKGKRLKATGYFFGAAAYAAVAVVGLANGFAQLAG